LIGSASGLPAGKCVTELVEQHDAEKSKVFVARPNLRAVNSGALGQFIGQEEEPGEVQINLDAAEFEKTNGAAHEGDATAENRRARAVLQGGRGGGVRRNQQTHRQHMGFEKAVAFEEILGAELRPIGEKRDPEEFFLPCEIDRVFEQFRAVAMPAKRIVHNKIFQKNDEAALSGADREEQIDHADDGAVPAQDKDAPAIRFLEDKAKALQLFLLVRAEVFLLAEKLAEKIGEFIQIFEYSRLDDDFAHGGFVIP
jgi:hypothetical protein